MSDRSDSPFDVDFSVIRTAIDMGHSMIDQILNGIHYGSEEVRNLLYEECDYIVECKVCRNLFRSFPNFVAHKRVYCQETSEEKLSREQTVQVRSDEEAVIVAPEAPTTVPDQSTANPGGPENTVIQKVINNQFAGKSKDYQFYTKIAEELEVRKATKVTNTVTMTSIPSNPHAVVVSYDKGDQSAKSTPKGSPKKSNQDSTDTSDKQETSPMVVDDLPSKSKSVANICMRLAAQQNDSVDQAMAFVQDVGGRQSRRARKSLPRKSSEEFVSFNPAEEVDTSKNTTVEKKNTSVADTNTAAVNKITSVVHKDVEAMDVDKNAASASPVKKASQDSADDWTKYCDVKKNLCKKCGTQYERSGPLKMHMMSTHGFKIGEFKCPRCSKYYMTVGTMVRHMRINHNATSIQVQKILKVFERRKAMEQKSKTSSSPTASSKSSPEQKTKVDLPSPVNTNSALYKALTGQIEEPVLKTIEKAKDTKRSTVSKESDSISDKIVGKAQMANSLESSKRLSAFSERKTCVSVPSKEQGISSEKKANSDDVSKDPISIISSEKPVTRVQRHVKTINDTKETVVSLTELKTGTPGNDSVGTSNEKPITRAQKEVNTVVKPRVSVVIEEEPVTRMQKEMSTVVKANVSGDTDEKPVTRTHRTLQTENEQSNSSKSLERDHIVTKKYDTRTASTQLQVTDNCSSEDKVKETNKNIMSSSDAGRQETDKEKVTSERARSESSSYKDETNKIAEKSLRSRSESSDRSKASESVSRAKSRDNSKAAGVETKKTNTRAFSVTSFSPVSSPSRISQSSSVPTSPTTSVNSNSCDGYSSKFKMTVQEMAELVESTSLAKFAKDRKKRARKILTSTKVKTNKAIPTRLSKPMKRGVRRKLLPVKKVYSTRLSTEDPLGGSDLSVNAELERSRKLLREMKRLQNSAGLVEENIYSSSSPALLAKKAHESSELATDSPRAPREKKQVESTVDSKSRALGNEVNVSPSDSCKGRGEKEVRTRNTSKERNELIEDSVVTKYALRDKSEDRNSSRNSSAERPKARSSDKPEDHLRNRNISRDRLENLPVTMKVFEDRETSEMGRRFETKETDSTKSQAKETESEPIETKREMRKQQDIEKRRQMKIQMQITKTNSLRKKMLAALKSVNNSKRIMNSKIPGKEEQTLEKTSDGNLADDKDKKTDAHNHRTRLATGSIYFNSELLKLSPSKVSFSPAKVSGVDGSPKKVTSDNDSASLSVVSRKLSLSPRRDKKGHERRQSEPVVFSLATGVKKCEMCNKVFWKLKSFKNHKCQKLRKKRMFSGSPKSYQNRTQEITVKKARVETPVKEGISGITAVFPGTKDDKGQGKTVERGGDKKDNVKKNSPKKIVTPQQPGSSRAQDVMDADSDTDSDFSGFSKSDLTEREFEYSDMDGGSVSSEAMEINDQDNSFDETGMFDSVGEDGGLVYKSTGKKTAKSGTVEEIWVEKCPEEKNSENRQYVRDPKNTSKIHCQSNKDFEKLIDEKEKKCLKCNMQYTTVSNLRRHAIRHLGWKRYKCKICLFTCYDKSECRVHYTRCHGNHLDTSNFLQFYIDLKREASKKRNAKRVTTIRSRRETVNTQEEDPYRKPRQTVVVKSSKDTPETEVKVESEDNIVVKSEANVVKIKDNVSKSRANSDKKTADSSENSEKPAISESENSILAKARMNLTKVLKDS